MICASFPLSWPVDKWLSHWILIPVYLGSNPSRPAKYHFYQARYPKGAEPFSFPRLQFLSFEFSTLNKSTLFIEASTQLECTLRWGSNSLILITGESIASARVESNGLENEDPLFRPATSAGVGQ